jgi:hypothetical protein
LVPVRLKEPVNEWLRVSRFRRLRPSSKGEKRASAVRARSAMMGEASLIPLEAPRVRVVGRQVIR